MQFVLFTDDIRELSVREACRAAKGAGFDGLDLTLRPNGHVLPENAGPGLAEAHEIAAEEGVVIPMVTTALTSADTPHAESVVAAVHSHIRNFKLGYWRYEPFGRIQEQLDDARRKLESIIRLTSRYHVRPCVHIHSGPLLTNSPLIYFLLKDYSPDDVGVYVDTMHMVVEGGLSGWEMTLDLVQPWVALVGVKNFIFQAKGRNPQGQQTFDCKICPLADGMSPLGRFFRRLNQIGYDGVVSLGSEYLGSGSWRRLSTSEIVEQSAADLQFLKRAIANPG